jgi:TonB family protein
MFSFRDMSLLAMAGTLAVPAVGLLAFAGLVGLRFQRRGAARFWASPAALALCLLPLALGVAVAGLLLRQVLTGLALTGTGGVAAIAAGCTEALLPTLLGLGATAALTACAFLATAVGSSKSSAPASSGLAGWALSALSLFSLVSLGGLLWLFLSTVALLNGTPADTSTVPARLSLLPAGAFALVAVTFVTAVAASFLAPRGPSGIGIRLVSLASFALCGLMSVVGLWATWSRSQALTQTALTGVRDGELPEPARMPVFVEPSEASPPPPPPPPRVTRPEPPEPVRRSIREARGAAVPPPSGEVHRVGGSIREPRKIRNVSPVYPEIAKQARVQGVVILEATIGPRGDVTAVRVLRGAPLLDQSAIDAVKQWVYEPTVLNGVPVPVIMTVTVSYKLAAP